MEACAVDPGVRAGCRKSVGAVIGVAARADVAQWMEVGDEAL